MTRQAWVNGSFTPIETASISILDRGFIFGDAIYEVTAVVDGRLLDIAPHLQRLDRSLGEIGIVNPYTQEGWTALHEDVVARNGLDEGLVYLQVTRGIAERDFLVQDDLAPTVVLFTQAKKILDNPNMARGIAVVTTPDIRWSRRDIKSTSLLAQVMAKMALRGTDASEVWMHEDGIVTEGASSTAYIVDDAGALRTRPFDGSVLPGVTRLSLTAIARDLGVPVLEEAFTIDAAKAAREAIMTSASSLVTPILRIDGHTVGEGKPGPVTLRLQAEYLRRARSERP